MAGVRPTDFDECVFLAGRPPAEEYIGFLVNQSIDGQSLNQRTLLDEWRVANNRVRELEQQEAGVADGALVHPLPASQAQMRTTVIADPMLQKSTVVPFDVALVDLDNLVVFQKFINLRYVRELQRDLPERPTAEQLFNFCLPTEHPVPPVASWRSAQNAFVFSSPSSDFRILDAVSLDSGNLSNYVPGGPIGGVVAIVVGYGTNYLGVVHAEGRLILSNGSHRAYALRDRGITRVPAVVYDVSRREELALAGLTEVPQNPDRFLLDPRPPVLRDYFDSMLCRNLLRKRLARQVRVVFNFETTEVASN